MTRTEQLWKRVSGFIAALKARDWATAKLACSPSGLARGETPAALFHDAAASDYYLENGDNLVVRDGRGLVMVEVVKAGFPPRVIHLLAEELVGGWVLSGVTGSALVADAYLKGRVPADARLHALPQCDWALAFGRRIVQSHERHGRVALAIGESSLAARSAGMMLDALLASPGATLECSLGLELIGPPHRAALRLVVNRPGRSVAEDFWLIVDMITERVGDGMDEAIEVRASASAMSLDILLSLGAVQ